jgi:hypothetical protein
MQQREGRIWENKREGTMLAHHEFGTEAFRIMLNKVLGPEKRDGTASVSPFKVRRRHGSLNCSSLFTYSAKSRI